MAGMGRVMLLLSDWCALGEVRAHRVTVYTEGRLASRN
jgi:hypothetical protein